MDKEFVKALRETIREQVIRKNSIEIDGLGLFEPVHEEQREEKTADGKVVMMPPRDRVEFRSVKPKKG